MGGRATLLLPALALALACAALVAAAPPPAAASTSQESLFQDDALLVYPPIAQVGQTLDTLQGLGVDRVRVSVYWRLVAPSPGASRRPSFDASDPSAYPAANWRRYDDLLRAAYARGLQVDFDITGPAPRWASQPAPDGNNQLDGAYEPDAADFGKFAHAVALRYSGSYAPPARKQNPPPPPPPNPNPLPVPITFGSGDQPPPPAAPQELPDGVLPRVNFWSVWNEPNQKLFLAPQYQSREEFSPRIYRLLADYAWQALLGSGHGGDTVVIGDTAPKGGGERDDLANMRPLRFVRALYCVSPRLRPLGGAAADALGCPDSDQVAGFPAQHPALFQASGYAHHPYALLTPPWLPARNPDDVAIADIPRLDGTLRRIFAAYRQRNRLPLYDTEFGYQTRPPDPFGFPPAVAAQYINEAEFISYLNPDVRSYHQFLLVDAPPVAGFAPSDPGYWSSFQTGLLYLNGQPKLSYVAYRMPIFIPAWARRLPGWFRVWGGVRPAPNGSRQVVVVQYRPDGRRTRWRTIRRVATRAPRHYIDTRLWLSRSGGVRLRWRDPATGQLDFSRIDRVRIG
jgi:hypothetical protein